MSGNIEKIFHLSWLGPLVFTGFLMFQKKLKTNKWPITKSTKNLFIIMVVPATIAFIVTLATGYGHYIHFLPVFLILIFSKHFDDLMPDQDTEKINCLIVYGAFCLLSAILSRGDIAHSLFDSIPFLIGQPHVAILIIPLIFLVTINIKFIFKNLWKIGVFLIFLFCTLQIRIATELLPSTSFSFIPQTFYKTKPNIKELRPVMKAILQETHWPAGTAVQRIYTIGIAKETSMVSHYLLAKETITRTGFILKLSDFFQDQKDAFSSPINVKEEIALMSIDKQDRSNKSRNFISLKPTGYIIIQHLRKFNGYSKNRLAKLAFFFLFPPYCYFKEGNNKRHAIYKQISIVW